MGLLDEISEYDILVDQTKRDIKEVYKSDNRPWVIGYSGGKDSTTLLQLVIESLIEMKKAGERLHKTVYVISSDTMVETPLIVSRISLSMANIQQFANEAEIPVIAELVRPAEDQTFWVNVIGKGYPVPNQTFRWCTDRMKIEPTNRFIKEKVSKHGEVVVLIGVREGESSSRDRVIKSHEIEGQKLMLHTTLSNAYTFAPIKLFGIDDVWGFLLANDSPWGDDNKSLFKMYSDSNSGECPLIIDSETRDKSGSCGNSRFGCWVCTVVNEDRSLTGFVENGEEWLRLLLNYRNWLQLHRDDRAMRMKCRANGNVYFTKIISNKLDDKTVLTIPKKSGREKVVLEVIGDSITSSNDEFFNLINEDELNSYIKKNNIDLSQGDIPNLIVKTGDDYSMLGLGPYTFDARFEMLKRLLECEKALEDRDIELITRDELREIRREWIKRGLIEDKLPKIYEEVFGESLNWEKNDVQLLTVDQYAKIDSLCKNSQLNTKPLIEMLQLEAGQINSRAKKMSVEKINNILTKDYLHY